jgi:tetratricopeptide (TPR) repeat protein
MVKLKFTRKQFLILVLILFCGYLLITSRQHLNRYHHTPITGLESSNFSQEGDLYLPEAPYLKFISLGNDGLVADLVLAKALTYFGSHYKQRHSFRFKHLKKLFMTAVQMDPHNKEVFLLAGNVLSDINVRDAIDILKLGMYYHPKYWKFPEMIGYHYFFRLNDSLNAGKYYELAAGMPDHPPYVPSLSGKFYQESGRYQEALRVLHNFYSTTNDEHLKASFEDSIHAIEEKIKTRDFMLKATVSRVISADVVEIKPDRQNPQFQSLRPKEIFKLAGTRPYSNQAKDEKEKLLAQFQLDFSKMVLVPGSQIRVTFHRENNGQLVRNSQHRLLGSIMLKNDQSFELLQIPEFPPYVEDLDLDKIHRLHGKIASFRFTVHHVSITESIIFLHSASDYRNVFSVLVPIKSSDGFIKKGPNKIEFFKQLTKKTITVSGLLIVNKEANRYQMKLYSPLQLTQ